MILLDHQLQKRLRMGNLRSLPRQRQLIDFASNDYLGLARSQELAEATLKEWSRNGRLLGSTGSRLLTGNATYTQLLEARIARFHGFETGTLFNCGYMANAGLHSAIATDADIFLFDSQVHASVRDGIRLSRAQAFPFRHNDPGHLEKRLKNLPAKGKRFITVASLYSTDGSQVPLREICHLSQRYGALLIVDEAHAVGVLGHSGRGLIAEQQLTSHVFALIATFGKALGTSGAIVLGSSQLRKALINFSRPYIYTTALPWINLAAIASSYALFPLMDRERSHLQHLNSLFRTFSPIHTLAIKGNVEARKLSTYLAEQGFDVRPLLSPTVRKGHETLRICMHAFNTIEEASRLLTYLERYR